MGSNGPIDEDKAVNIAWAVARKHSDNYRRDVCDVHVKEVEEVKKEMTALKKTLTGILITLVLVLAGLIANLILSGTNSNASANNERLAIAVEKLIEVDPDALRRR